MAKIPLRASASATVIGGTATVRLSPGVAGSKWAIKRIVTTCTTGPDIPVVLDVYRNVISDATRLDGTSSAGQDTSEIPDDGIELQASETLVGIYSGATNGAVVTLIVEGDNYTGR